MDGLVIQMREVDCREAYHLAIRMNDEKLKRLAEDRPATFYEEYRKLLFNNKRLQWAIKDTEKRLRRASKTVNQNLT